MRRKIVSLAFVSVVVVMAVAVVAPMMAGAAPASPDETAAPIAVQRVAIPGPVIRDEAAMVLIGSALIGLAAVVRRAA